MLVAVLVFVTISLVNFANINLPGVLHTGGNSIDRIRHSDLENCRSDSRGPASDRFDIVDSNRGTRLDDAGPDIRSWGTKESDTPRLITIQ